MLTSTSKISISIMIVLSILVLGASGSVVSADKQATEAYPLNTCLVSGEKLGSMGDPVVYNHNGREIKFCCKGCVNGFKKDAEKYLKKLDAAIIKQQLQYYPVDTCVVSGGKLGSMGDPVDYVHGNRLVRFCCSGCIDGFKKNPAKYLQTLDKAVITAQVKTYPLNTCVVTGMKLGSMGDPVDYVFGNRLVRFCCGGCASSFSKDPGKYLAKLDAKPKKKSHGHEGCTHDH